LLTFQKLFVKIICEANSDIWIFHFLRFPKFHSSIDLFLTEEIDSLANHDCGYGTDDEENESNPEDLEWKFIDKAMPFHSVKV
jgi:hypothetical protein